MRIKMEKQKKALINSNNELKPADVDQPDKTREKLKNRYGIKK